MSRIQIHTSKMQELREQGIDDDDLAKLMSSLSNEDLGDMIECINGGWYYVTEVDGEKVININELELEEEEEVTKMNKADRAAATIGKSIAKTELWTKDTGIPMAKDTGKKVGQATVKAGKAIRRFGKGLAEGYRQAKQ